MNKKIIVNIFLLISAIFGKIFTENKKNNTKIIPGASYYQLSVWNKEKEHREDVFYTFNGNVLCAYENAYSSGEWREKMNYYEKLLDPSAPKPQPITYYIRYNKYSHSAARYDIQFYDKNNNMLTREDYDIDDKKITHQQRKSISFPTNNHKDFENFPLDLSIAKEKVNDKAIPGASYAIYSTPGVVEFYTYNGTKLYEWLSTDHLFLFEYFDRHAPKPQPAYYHIKTIRYDDGWHAGEVTEDLITFYDKNHNKIATYKYDIDKKIISESWGEEYFLKKKKKERSFSHEFKFPTDNFEALKDFPLDLSAIFKDLSVTKEQKNEKKN